MDTLLVAGCGQQLEERILQLLDHTKTALPSDFFAVVAVQVEHCAR